jgi:alpha-2-macroglobulin
MILAAEALADRSQAIALSVDGVREQGAFFKSWNTAGLGNKSVTIADSGDAPVAMVLTTSGNPVTPEPEAEHGYRIERVYYTLDGKPLQSSAVKQNDRFVVALSVTENEAAFARRFSLTVCLRGLRSTIRTFLRAARQRLWRF